MPSQQQPTPQQVTGLVVGLALLVALVASLGSLWLSLGMDLKACPLCLYQRACMFSVVAVLAVGLIVQEMNAATVALMGLGPAVAAAGVGGFHVYLEYTRKLECPTGIAGIGTAPQQALVAEGFVAVLLLFAGLPRLGPAVLSTALGGILAALLIQSAPKPETPEKPHKEGRVDTCRPPYVQLAPVQPK